MFVKSSVSKATTIYVSYSFDGLDSYNDTDCGHNYCCDIKGFAWCLVFVTHRGDDGNKICLR